MSMTWAYSLSDSKYVIDGLPLHGYTTIQQSSLASSRFFSFEKKWTHTGRHNIQPNRNPGIPPKIASFDLSSFCASAESALDALHTLRFRLQTPIYDCVPLAWVLLDDVSGRRRYQKCIYHAWYRWRLLNEGLDILWKCLLWVIFYWNAVDNVDHQLVQGRLSISPRISSFSYLLPFFSYPCQSARLFPCSGFVWLFLWDVSDNSPLPHQVREP